MLPPAVQDFLDLSLDPDLDGYQANTSFNTNDSIDTRSSTPVMTLSDDFILDPTNWTSDPLRVRLAMLRDLISEASTPTITAKDNPSSVTEPESEPENPPPVPPPPKDDPSSVTEPESEPENPPPVPPPPKDDPSSVTEPESIFNCCREIPTRPPTSSTTSNNNNTPSSNYCDTISSNDNITPTIPTSTCAHALAPSHTLLPQTTSTPPAPTIQHQHLSTPSVRANATLASANDEGTRARNASGEEENERCQEERWDECN
ncbi:hypothetical protein EV702DRAFT_1195160 [Suillus placidus]|uniref:Uncharacterized protein n=1 Tax=Suillus placidus TaxID=48579 RepID=A0A9P6ZZU7_9AGAM|nr:hypothetical protein EV702DRAFT_1195160 [Suillus placidus]